MTDHKQMRIEIDKKKHMRTKEISRMIDEGGLGAYYYYDYPSSTLPNEETKSKEISRMIDEGGMGTHSYYNEKRSIKNFEE